MWLVCYLDRLITEKFSCFYFFIFERCVLWNEMMLSEWSNDLNDLMIWLRCLRQRWYNVNATFAKPRENIVLSLSPRYLDNVSRQRYYDDKYSIYCDKVVVQKISRFFFNFFYDVGIGLNVGFDKPTFSNIKSTLSTPTPHPTLPPPPPPPPTSWCVLRNMGVSMLVADDLTPHGARVSAIIMLT